MSEYSEHTGHTRHVVLEPQITRAFWSKRRAWQDEEVRLHVETRYVKDGTPLRLWIWEDGTDDRQADACIAEVHGKHQVKNGRCEATYRIKWDPRTLGRDLRLQRDQWEFYFIAAIQDLSLKKKSALLYVDLHELVPSV